MVATLQRVLSTNMVLVGISLLSQSSEAEKFTSVVDPDLRLEVGAVTNLATGESEPSRRITSDIDRIVLELLPTRSTITRQYPSPDDLGRLAEVITAAVGCTQLDGRQPTAYGYNIETLWTQDSGQPALSYLGHRLFSNRSLGNPDWKFVGATTRVVFADGVGRWTITAEPRFNDVNEERVFVSLNLHKDEQILPVKEEIEVALNSVWEEVLAFMKQLDPGSA